MSSHKFSLVYSNAFGSLITVNSYCTHRATPAVAIYASSQHLQSDASTHTSSLTARSLPDLEIPSIHPSIMIASWPVGASELQPIPAGIQSTVPHRSPCPRLYDIRLLSSGAASGAPHLLLHRGHAAMTLTGCDLQVL